MLSGIGINCVLKKKKYFAWHRYKKKRVLLLLPFRLFLFVVFVPSHRLYSENIINENTGLKRRLRLGQCDRQSALIWKHICDDIQDPARAWWWRARRPAHTHTALAPMRTEKDRIPATSIKCWGEIAKASRQRQNTAKIKNKCFDICLFFFSLLFAFLATFRNLRRRQITCKSFIHFYLHFLVFFFLVLQDAAIKTVDRPKNNFQSGTNDLWLDQDQRIRRP